MVGNASVQLAEGLSVTVVTIVTVIACVIIMIGLMAFMKYSKAGHAMLAVSEDDGAAQLMGINVNATIALTFAIGSGTGSHRRGSALLRLPVPDTVHGIYARYQSIRGSSLPDGIGSIPGAFIGGILLGIIEILGKAYISSQLADAIVFAVLIVVLVVKPTGLLGKQIQEKV